VVGRVWVLNPMMPPQTRRQTATVKDATRLRRPSHCLSALLRASSIVFFKERQHSAQGFVGAAMEKFEVEPEVAKAMLLYGRNTYYYQKSKLSAALRLATATERTTSAKLPSAKTSKLPKAKLPKAKLPKAKLPKAKQLKTKPRARTPRARQSMGRSKKREMLATFVPVQPVTEGSGYDDVVLIDTTQCGFCMYAI
jgi:hypothetical protein